MIPQNRLWSGTINQNSFIQSILFKSGRPFFEGKEWPPIFKNEKKIFIPLFSHQNGQAPKAHRSDPVCGFLNGLSYNARNRLHNTAFFPGGNAAGNGRRYSRPAARRGASEKSCFITSPLYYYQTIVKSILSFDRM